MTLSERAERWARIQDRIAKEEREARREREADEARRIKRNGPGLLAQIFGLRPEERTA